MSALLCAVAIFAAGCHRNNLTSGYGVAWVTLTDQPGDFSSYIVDVDSITLTRSDTATVAALASPETVDFTKLGDLSELWGSARRFRPARITSASIVLDYTSVAAGGQRVISRHGGQRRAAATASDGGRFHRCGRYAVHHRRPSR